MGEREIMTKSYTVTLIEGDGIGPEVTRAALDVVDAAGVKVEWDRVVVGARAMELHGALLPEETLESIRRNRVALKGPVTTPVGEGFPSLNVAIRQKLDLFACIRPVKSLTGVPSRFPDVDLVVCRENTEDLYAGKEHEIIPGVVVSLKIITEKASTRIAEYAFTHAVMEGRHKITAVHKANIMKLSDGLFLTCCRKVAEKYPSIAYSEMIVDNTCQQLVYNPHQFDVLLTSNLYGDIISDLAAGLVGGLGVVPGANIGEKYAVFEAVHGSWPEAAGKNIANPVAMVLTAVMMLRHLEEEEAAKRIEAALFGVLEEGKVLTGDLGGKASTSEFAEAVVSRLRS